MKFRPDDRVTTMPIKGVPKNMVNNLPRPRPVKPAKPVPSPVYTPAEMPPTYTPAQPQGGTSTTGSTSIGGQLVPARDPSSGGVTPMPVFVDPTSYGPAEPEPKRVVEGSSYPNTGATRMPEPVGYKKGGKVSSASKRADGIAQRGKTRGVMR